jgi:hypothetical protein
MGGHRIARSRNNFDLACLEWSRTAQLFDRCGLD